MSTKFKIILMIFTAFSMSYLFTFNSANASPPREYVYRYHIKDIRDADTIQGDISLGLNLFLSNEPIRLLGLNTPESRANNSTGYDGKAGKKATQIVVDLLENEKYLILQTLNPNACKPRGKYGRILGILWLPSTGQNLNELIWQKTKHLGTKVFIPSTKRCIKHIKSLGIKDMPFLVDNM